MELAQFDVRVVVVVTGGVISSIARNERSLAPDSLYLPLAAEYEERQTHSQANGMPTDAYARSVVRQVLGWRKPSAIWEGGGASLVWWVSNFLPNSFMVRVSRDGRTRHMARADWNFVKAAVMTRMFKLWKLRQSNQKKLV